MSQKAVVAAVALTAASIALTATAVARADGARPDHPPAPARLAVTSAAASGPTLPGGVVTGSITISNRSAAVRRVSDVVFADPASDTCSTAGLALAPTIAPSPESPLPVPAKGTTTLTWTAYMDGESEQACQGATLASDVLLDGEPAGTVTLTAGTLDQPPPPTGGLTTSTRAAVHWAPSAVADPGWVVERAQAGSDDWQPACGSSAARPVRALACTDTGLTASTAYTYRVTVRTGHWHMTSRPSAPIRTQDRPSA